MLDQIGGELRIAFGDVADIVEANLCRAKLHPVDNIICVDADEIVRRNLVDNDPVNMVLAEQTVPPVLPVVQRHLLEPFFVEAGRVEQSGHAATGVLAHRFMGAE